MSQEEESPADEHDVEDAPLVLKCDTASAALWSWVVTAIAVAVAGYSVYSMTRGPQDWARDGPILAAFLCGCPAVAGFLILASLWGTLHWWKQGRTTLRIPSGYIIEGAPLKGTVECSKTLDVIGPAKATLECLETRTTRRGRRGETRTESRKVWSGEAELHPQRQVITARSRSAAAGTQFALQIDVPEIRRVDQPAPDAPGVASASARVHWKLTIVAPLRGLDHESHFDVPILTKDE